MKELFKFIFSKVFLKHLCAAVGVIVLVAVVVLLCLSLYTHHGESITVPDLRNMRVEQVESVLNDLDLKYEVVDSMYTTEVAPGAVMEQTPMPHEKIKRNRTIYIVVNAVNKQRMSVPDVQDMSLRNAKNILEQYGFKVAVIERVDYAFRDLAVGVKSTSGQTLLPGSKLPVGTNVILVVGSSTVGYGSDSLDVDDEGNDNEMPSNNGGREEEFFF